MNMRIFVIAAFIFLSLARIGEPAGGVPQNMPPTVTFNFDQLSPPGGGGCSLDSRFGVVTCVFRMTQQNWQSMNKEKPATVSFANPGVTSIRFNGSQQCAVRGPIRMPDQPDPLVDLLCSRPWNPIYGN